MPEHIRLARRVLAGCAVAGLGLLAVGLVTQHLLGMQPCSWCVLQRLLFAAIVLVGAIGATARSSPIAVLLSALLADLLALCGAAAALYQHLVASASDSCAVSLADRVIMALSLHELAPWMFLADAPCNQANQPLLGVPFALWSLAAFLMLGTAAAGAAVTVLRGRSF
ncbi:MAG: disulfide bond formation protein B [Quisquiliibacterium sp.]